MVQTKNVKKYLLKFSVFAIIRPQQRGNAVVYLKFELGSGIVNSVFYPKTFKTERGCPFLIKINKKESTYNNQKKKSKKKKLHVIIQKKENKKKNIRDNKYVVFKYKRELKIIAFKIQYKSNKLHKEFRLECEVINRLRLLKLIGKLKQDY